MIPVQKVKDLIQRHKFLENELSSNKIDKSKFAETWDLGQEWVDWTGLPFVFAMWTARADLELDLSSIEQALSAARDEGVQNIAQIAAQHSSELGISQQQCEVYLRDHLYFYLVLLTVLLLFPCWD